MKALVLIATFAGALTVAVAGSAASGADALHASYDGEHASASFWTIDGTVGTYVAVDAANSAYRQGGPPASPSGAFIYVYRYDVISGSPLLDVAGYPSLAPDAFHVGNKLSTASLSTATSNFSLWDWVSNSPVTLNLTVDWTATSAPYSWNGHSVYRYPTLTMTGHEAGTVRDAVATGTLEIGGTTVALLATYGMIGSYRGGWMMVSRNP